MDLSELGVGFSEHRHEEAFLNCRLWCSSSYVDSGELGYLKALVNSVMCGV